MLERRPQTDDELSNYWWLNKLHDPARTNDFLDELAKCLAMVEASEDKDSQVKIFADPNISFIIVPKAEMPTLAIYDGLDAPISVNQTFVLSEVCVAVEMTGEHRRFNIQGTPDFSDRHRLAFYDDQSPGHDLIVIDRRDVEEADEAQPKKPYRYGLKCTNGALEYFIK